MKIFVTPSVLLQAVVLAACLSSEGICHAAPPRTEAATLRAQGDIAADSDNLNEAIELWLRAWNITPDDHGLACNLGRALFRVAKYSESALWLTRCVQLFPDARTPAEVDRLIRATNELNAAREQVATLSIQAEPRLQVVIDAEIARTTPMREDIFLAPGSHHIDAYAKDGRSTSMDVTVEQGKAQSVVIKFPEVEKLGLTPVPAIPPILAPPLTPGLAVPPMVPISPPLMLGPGLMVHAKGRDGVLPYFVTSPDMPSEPEPGPFRVWPIVVGSALGTGALATGIVFAVEAANTDDPNKEKVYDTAKYLSLCAFGLLSVGTLGYALYEDRRTSVTLIGSSVSWSHRW